jgi:hypothetical protein
LTVEPATGCPTVHECPTAARLIVTVPLNVTSVPSLTGLPGEIEKVVVVEGECARAKDETDIAEKAMAPANALFSIRIVSLLIVGFSPGPLPDRSLHQDGEASRTGVDEVPMMWQAPIQQPHP